VYIVLVVVATVTMCPYRISSNRSRVSNTSRGRCKGEYTARLVGLLGISLCSIKYKTKNLDVLNNDMFIGEPGGSNRSRGSATIVLIKAGGFY